MQKHEGRNFAPLHPVPDCTNCEHGEGVAELRPELPPESVLSALVRSGPTLVDDGLQGGSPGVLRTGVAGQLRTPQAPGSFIHVGAAEGSGMGGNTLSGLSYGANTESGEGDQSYACSSRHGDDLSSATAQGGRAKCRPSCSRDDYATDGQADHARTLHLHRQLVQAAEHGVALLAALGLPQIIHADIVTVEPIAIGDALEVVIAHLDALDAPNKDLEEGGDTEASLGWTAHTYQAAFNSGDTLDIELDTADFEDDDPAEETSLETRGRGFVRCGADDDEDGFDIEEQHDAERENEHGSEDEPYPWRLERNAWALVKEAHGHL